MPGILKMNSSVNGGSGARDVDSKKRAHDGKMVNGERTIVRKDSPASAPAVRTPSYNGGDAHGATPAVNQMAQLPPDLAHVPSENYHSLSKLIQRISQETYNELNECLLQMRELKPPQLNGNLPNGLGLPNPQDAETSKNKKLLLLRFAHDNRAKFIKLLVLTEWGRKASVDLSKLIDLFSWARAQSYSQDRINEQIEFMKFVMNDARQLNPDIKTALEILGTGKAGWIPDMGFIPPPPMSADKALKLLRYMNVSLSTRLIIHEKIPHQLSKWRIENGRVTFIVDGEFEFDLMSFVEDSSDQFHFIDMRFLFYPAPSIAADSRFFNRLKLGVDNLLREEGLEACFGYLHNVTLSHKIFILSTQVNDLLRTGWAGSLRSEFAHRVLWIQYWLNRPGKKSWIEIGVASNKPKDGKVSWRGPPIPSITARWFREGVHVQDVDLKLDWNNLSVERVIKRVIALHVGHLLRTTHQAFGANVSAQVTLADNEPSNCRLAVSIGSKENTTSLSIEPITGRYTLSPATPLSNPAEIAINRSLEPTVTRNTITQFLARSIAESIQRYSQQLGWQPVARQALRMEVVKAAVNLNVLRFTLFWPRGWSTNTALAAIVDATGESWWICEIGEKGSTIVHAQKIAIESMDGRPPPINRPTLSRIERVAIHQLAYSITSRALGQEGKTYSLRYEIEPPRRPASLDGVVRGWALHVRTSELLGTKPGDDSWLEPAMQITGHGFRSDYRNVWHIVTGTMVSEAATDMQKLMSASPQTNFTFSEGGKFSVLLSTPFGHEVVSELKARLRDLNRLRSFATTLEKRKMLLKSSSLQQVEFQYSQGLSVKVLFGQGTDIQVKFGDRNPHNRIHSFLTDIINDRSPGLSRSSHGDNNGLDRFCTSLIWTRPLLTVLNELENRTPGNVDNPAVHVHDLRTYRITYTNPPCSFDFKLKPKDDRMLWDIEDNEGKPADLRPKTERSPHFKRLGTLKSALQKLFRERDVRWWGVRTGIIADIDGIPDALRRLNETVISCYVEGGVKQEVGDSAPVNAPPARQPNNSSTTNRPNGNNAANAKPQPGRLGGNQHDVITID
ncbi:mediator complex subunit [Didymosphaeria variabile]|uniref:Mediator of RNA polymerase II transcription subunit 14 n=1 Tax=Didymosphaeria variabile TaxID=1932322 RepID=A0A9W9C7L1_9PLEO|nr:mediator complex subunit [Didymosphaeria variabile]KAJ4348403.1 mediator complex subunit [Didymosphaeria variabile]